LQTKLTPDIEFAASFLRSGEVVAFPTETVYGLGGNAFDEKALRKIFAAKGRPADNPLIIHIGATEQLAEIVSQITPAAQRLIEAFWPGPLTVVLPKAERIPLLATANLQTVGVRAPAHPTANAFLRACGVPVAAPSANLSGRPSPTTWQAVAQDLDGRIACILQGGQTRVGLESTVVDCAGDTPHVLRAGAVTLEQLRAVLPAAQALTPDADAPARSPGLRHQHYAPRARVILVESPPDFNQKAAYIGLYTPACNFTQQRICRDTEEYAHELFAFFRECDENGVNIIYCQAVAEIGLGVALMDRIMRAAAIVP
jgi:L-threonylcarbamoyladenylate synthase